MATVVFSRPAARDALGDRPSDPVVVATLSGRLEPVSRRELVAEASDPSEERLRFYVRARGFDVAHHDRAEIDGAAGFRVIGPPQVWGTSGTVIDLGREAG